jgi:hypothetical protein
VQSCRERGARAQNVDHHHQQQQHHKQGQTRGSAPQSGIRINSCTDSCRKGLSAAAGSLGCPEVCQHDDGLGERTCPHMLYRVIHVYPTGYTLVSRAHSLIQLAMASYLMHFTIHKGLYIALHYVYSMYRHVVVIMQAHLFRVHPKNTQIISLCLQSKP